MHDIIFLLCHSPYLLGASVGPTSLQSQIRPKVHHFDCPLSLPRGTEWTWRVVWMMSYSPHHQHSHQNQLNAAASPPYLVTHVRSYWQTYCVARVQPPATFETNHKMIFSTYQLSTIDVLVWSWLHEMYNFFYTNLIYSSLSWYANISIILTSLLLQIFQFSDMLIYAKRTPYP